MNQGQEILGAMIRFLEKPRLTVQQVYRIKGWARLSHLKYGEVNTLILAKMAHRIVRLDDDIPEGRWESLLGLLGVEDDGNNPEGEGSAG